MRVAPDHKYRSTIRNVPYAAADARPWIGPRFVMKRL